MEILITGGAGFVGSNLALALSRAGYNVTVVDNFSTGSRRNAEELVTVGRVRVLEIAIEDPRLLSIAPAQGGAFDQIYHLACPTGVPNIQKLGDEMLLACSVGTWQVLTLAVNHKADVVFTSSSEIYGQPQVSPQTEDYSGNVNPQGWRSNYEEGKRFAETLVAWFGRKYGLRAITVRLFNAYGPRMSFEDMRVVPRFALQALTGQALTVQGNGAQKRTLCYIDDIVAGLGLVMAKGTAGEIYNLGSDREITMLALANAMLQLVNAPNRIAYQPRPSHDHESRRPALTKIKALGWQAQDGLADGLRSTLAFYQEHLARS